MKNKIIEYDDKFKFCFVENEEEKGLHPVSNYYTKLDDLSINLLISLKWIKWGYFFMVSLCNGLDLIKEDYKFKHIISKSIQIMEESKENKKIIIIDNVEIENSLDFENLIKNQYNDEILGVLFGANTKIHIKLKINLREFLIISHEIYPTLIKWEKNVSF